MCVSKKILFKITLIFIFVFSFNLNSYAIEKVYMNAIIEQSAGNLYFAYQYMEATRQLYEGEVKDKGEILGRALETRKMIQLGGKSIQTVAKAGAFDETEMKFLKFLIQTWIYLMEGNDAYIAYVDKGDIKQLEKYNKLKEAAFKNIKLIFSMKKVPVK